MWYVRYINTHSFIHIQLKKEPQKFRVRYMNTCFMEVTSLYTNIPKRSIRNSTVSSQQHYWNNCQGYFFQFAWKNYLQMYGAQLMGTKMAVEFANIFVSKVEKEILIQSDI